MFDANTTMLETRTHLVADLRAAVGAEHDVLAPLAEQKREARADFIRRRERGDRLVAHFVRITVRARGDELAMQLVRTCDRRPRVDESRREQQRATVNFFA